MTLTPKVDFKSLFESAPGLYLVLLPDFTIVAVSDAYLKATMTVREVIAGHGLFEIFPDNPDDNEADGVLNLRASLNYVVQHKEPHRMAVQKYDIRRPDGVFEARYWSPLNTPVLNAQNEVAYIIHNVTDVTDAQRAGDSFRKSEKDFHSLVNSVRDYAIFMLDIDGKVTTWNSGAETIKGYKSEEIIGKSIEVFYTPEQKALDEPKRNLKKALEYGHYETEGYRVRKDGSRFYANVVFTPLYEDGQLYGYAKVTKDITEKRKSEDTIRFLATITDNIQDPVIATDDNFFITSWNGGAEKLFGWKAKEVLGKSSAEILKADVTSERRQDILDEFAKNDFWHGEVIYHSRSGVPVIALATLSHLKDAGGVINGNLILVRNITTRKKAEQELSKLNVDLEQRIMERTEQIQRSEKQYRYLFENNPMPMFIMDLKTYQFLDVNKIAVVQYGYSRKEFLSISALDIRPEEDIELFKRLDFTFNSDAAEYNKGIWKHRKKDGAIITAEVIVHEILYEGAEARLILANDITEQKKAEEKLINSEKQFRHTLDSMLEGAQIIGFDWRYIYVNESMTRHGKYSKEEMIGYTVMEKYPGIEHTEIFKIYQRCFKERIPFHLENEFLFPDKTMGWFELSFQPVPEGIFILSVDITDRKKAEEKLASSELRFRSLIENSAEGIALTDEFSNIIYRSPASEKITGKSPLNNSLARTHREDLESIKSKFSESLSNPAVPITFQGRFLHAEGHYFWMEGTLTNLLHADGVNAIVANYRDITERKKLEDLLHKANTLARIGGWEIDMINKTVYWSDITKEIHETEYNYVPDLASGINFYKEGKGRNLITKKLNDAIELGKSWDIELQIITAKNNEKWVRTIGETEFVNGKCVRIYGSFQDINHRKKVEEKIRNLNIELEERVEKRTEQLQKSAEEMEAFSYSVSHDLRAPLRGIIGFANILEEDYGSKLDNEAKRIISVIKKNTSKMGHLIDDLLSFSRTGRLELIKTKIDSEKIIKEIIADVAANGHHKKIEWHVHSLPLINADLNTINQVWINLISNAVKYSGNTINPKIEIGSNAKNGTVTFFVKDNGVGFDEKYKGKLFKVFQRLHTTEEFEGTGIGLAIVDKIIAKHGGNVWAEADLNKGATFYFSLPVDKSH
ncbi:MAG TPA: PAS domain S-box protein [Ginsengibacter sp.]